MIEIRRIKDEEIEAAEEIMRRSFPQSYHSIFYLYPESTLVAAEDGKILGGINLDIYNAAVKVGYIGWLYVSEDARGRGIGEKLVDEAIVFLEDEIKADEILLCIEGDNPSSFKNFSSRPGFEIMQLRKEIKTFKRGIFKVYRHASRFFDMGYFMWHKSRGDNNAKHALDKSTGKQIISFLCTLLFNTLLYLLMILKFRSFSPHLLMIPSAVLSLRAITEAISLSFMGIKPLYLSWDTSWISSLLSVFLPFYFPSPGGIYPKGDDWSLKDKSRMLGISALFTAAAEAILLLILRGRYQYISFALPLFLLDTVFPMYPFCGFLSSRIRRTCGKLYPLVISLSIIISVISIFF